MVDHEKMQAENDEIDRLVGSIVTTSSRIEWAFMAIRAVCLHPGDQAAEDAAIGELFGDRGKVVASRCVEAVTSSSLPYPRLRDKIFELCQWYTETYDERNRAVHDVFLHMGYDEEASLFRYVTKRGGDHTPVAAAASDLRRLVSDLDGCSHFAFGYLGTLYAIVRGEVPPEGRPDPRSHRS
jgi:hypothetical protein